MKAVRMDENIHKTLIRIAKKHKTSLKGFLELSISYFQRTGIDPRELSDHTIYDQSKALTGIKKQLDFLVRMQKTSEKSFHKPISEAISSIENQLDYLSKNGKKTAADFDKTSVKELSKISCPNCQEICQELETEICCESCEFSLPMQVGNVHFSKDDIRVILTGGMTRIYDGVEIGERRSDGIRFYLDSEYKLRTQNF